MKILRLRLKGYGPIRDLKLEPGDWELVHGGNESGKTALVEALAYVLLKKNVKLIRYGKPTDLHLEIEHNGATYAAGDKKAAVLLPTAEISSLHYVQASESELYAKDAANFWEGIKIALSRTGAGLTNAHIIKKIYDKVGIQAKEKDWTVAKKPLVTSRLERRAALMTFFTQMEQIEETRQRAKKLAQDCAAAETELKLIQDWKKFREYQALRELYDRFRAGKNALTDFQRFEERYLETWRTLEAEKKSRLGIEENLQRSREELAQIEKEVADLKRQDDIIRNGGLDGRLTPSPPPPAAPTMFLPILLFLAGLLGLILSFRFHFTLLVPFGLFGASIIALAIVQYKKYTGQRTMLEDELVLVRARVLFPDIKTFDDLRRRIEGIRIARARAEATLSEKQNLLQTMAGTKPMEQIEQEINELRNKTGLPEMRILQEKIGEKSHRQNDHDVIRTQLQMQLKETDENRWEALVAARAAGEPGTPADLKREAALLSRLEKQRSELTVLQNRIAVFETARREIHGVDDYRAALLELNQLERELEGFDLEKKAAIKIEEVLTAISGELDDFITGIITGPNGLDEYFHRATGRYRSVQVHGHDLRVVDDGERVFGVDQLSSGTRDQLLLCFRLTALEKIYPAGTFLILDDAFIFADWLRRKAMVALLKQFSDKGNQVLYLTSDDHTRDLFAQAGAHITELK